MRGEEGRGGGEEGKGRGEERKERGEEGKGGEKRRGWWGEGGV